LPRRGTRRYTDTGRNGRPSAAFEERLHTGAPEAAPGKEGEMEDKGLCGLLFDLSFSEFVTTRVIKVLFILGIVLSALGALAMIGAGFAAGTGRGILMLVLSPLVFLLYALVVRVWCELIIVVFRIAENTSRLVDRDKG
jgi:hypothetical protein